MPPSFGHARRWAPPLFLFCAACMQGAGDGATASRAAEIQAERERKAQNLRPEELRGLHRIFQYAQKNRLAERLTAGAAGFRLRMGGLGPGSGFALGTEYFRPDLSRDRVAFRASISGSAEEFYLGDLQLSLPRLARDRGFMEFYSRQQFSPSIDYYGPGPESLKSGRTAYAMEETVFDMRAGVRPLPRLRVGGLAQYLLFNVGPGRRPQFASTETVFSPSAAPGLSDQTDFMRAGAFLAYDAWHAPGVSRGGGRYRFEFSRYFDRVLRRHSFNRLDLDAERYFSFLNGQRTVLVRGRASLTGARRGDAVPFFLQPRIGGAADLRGFRARRFYGDNAVVLNGEYRWVLFTTVDAALFADAGRVFDRWGQLGLRNLERSYGFGFRFKQDNNAVFWRIDLAFSREGPQLWLTFEDIF